MPLANGATLQRPAPGAAQKEEDPSIRGFSIPNTRSANARMERAIGNLQAKRWNEAIEDLQVLIDEHGAELVPVAGLVTKHTPVHRGAAGWAAGELLSLPVEAAQLYRRRFEARARAALDLARSSGDRQAIIEVAERWPATLSATDAWWSLGDLELEIGDLEQARHAWARAITQRPLERRAGLPTRLYAASHRDWESVLAALQRPGAAEAGAVLGEGELRRVQLAIATLADENPLAEANRLRRLPNANLRIAGPGEGASDPPSSDASTWARPFSIPGPHPFDPGNSGNLFPIRVGDLVFVSTSLRLFAINAYSGSLRWASEEPEGWSGLKETRAQFYAGISHRDAMIAPAASEGIVVAALQVPVSDINNATFRNIAITTIIPDRRLYAYDIETGKELWNHHPPENWDGESGSFTDRVSVAGPPVVSASRVIVPVHRMYGRIEFYVACFDLVSGEALWTTQLVSGQRELNMFARAEEEFSAPPVRIEDDRVVVLTQLGAVAMLDLFSGSILWETLYEQIPSPPRNSFSAAKIKNFWRNAPPVVADGVIVVTPFDSRKLLGLDFETGETRWSMDYNTIDALAGPAHENVNLLIGADEKMVFLGGWPVMALKASGGLYAEEPKELHWRYPAGEYEGDESTSARALLLADRVIIPTSDERIELDRFGGGRRHKAVPWKGGRSGNLLVENGTLYTLTSQYLDGYFEWDMLLERARRHFEETGRDVESSTALAGLMVERSRTELEAGRTARAKDWLVEAEGLLQPFMQGRDLPEDVTRQMHSLLRTRGRVFIDLADGKSALKALHAARQFAPSVSMLTDTLIEEYKFVYGADYTAQLEILRTLEDLEGGVRISTEVVRDPHHPYGWRFEAFVPEPDDRTYAENTSARMWTMLERAGLAAQTDNPRLELVALHQLLEYYPDEALGPRDEEITLSQFATRRIGILIDAHGRGIYQEFERKAAELLAEARETHQREVLKFVSELYPHSIAGREANDERLKWATSAGDVEAVATIVMSELPGYWSAENAQERDVQLMLHLGAALEQEGNFWFANALHRALAKRSAASISTAPRHEGRSVGELVAAIVQTPPPAAPQEARFQVDMARYFVQTGSHRYLGEIPPGLNETETPGPVYLFTRQEGGRQLRQREEERDLFLVAYSAQSLEQESPQPLWEYSIPPDDLPQRWDGSLDFIPGGVIASTKDRIYALDRMTGNRLWNEDWSTPDHGDVESVVAGAGIVVVSVRDRRNTASLCAIDWTGGQQLWQTEFDSIRYSREALIGADRVVVMPRRNQKVGRILDLFTGRDVADFELPIGIHQTAHVGTWIEDNKLIVPWFINGRLEERNRIVAIDLRDGRLSWNTDFGTVAGGRRELRSILQTGGRTYLALRPGAGSEQEGVRGIFVELDTRLGAMARVGSFEQENDLRMLGVPAESRVQLSSPVIYLLNFVEGNSLVRIQAFDLQRRALLWSHQLELTRDELHSPSIGMPAESTDLVAFVLSKRESKFRDPVSTLHVLDKRTGVSQREIGLASDLGSSINIELLGLGQSLLLAGDSLLELQR